MSARTIKLASAAAAAGLTAVILAGIGSEIRARAAIARLIGERPGLSAAGASVDLLDGSVTLRGLDYEHAGLRVRIGSLRLGDGRGALATLGGFLVSPANAFPMGEAAPDDAPAPGDGASTPSGKPIVEAPATGQAPGIAKAENVVIAYQNVTYTIPAVEIAGTTLTSADLAAMLDVNSAESIEARLRRLNAASITMREIKADTVSGDFEQHWEQQQVLFASITNGKAAIGSAGSGTLKTKSAKGTSLAETGGLQMTGIDMGQIVHVATTARTDEHEAQQVLADSLVVSAIKLDGGDTGPTITLASLKEAGLKARTLALISQARSVLLATGKAGDPAVDAFVNDIAGSVSFDLLQADDLVEVPAKTSKDGVLRLARLTIVGARDRKIGDVSLQALRFEQGPNHMALASAELKGLTIPATFDGKSLPTFETVDLSGIAFDADTAEEGKPEKRVAFDVAHAGLSATGAKIDALPAKAIAQVDNFKITIGPDMSPMLIALGYPKLDVSSHFASRFDAAAQALTIEDWTVNGVGMGKASLKLHLGKVTDAIMSPDADAQKAATAAMVFKGMELVVADGGLVDRLLAYKATQDGMSVAQERENAIDMVRNKLPVLAGDPPKLKPLEEAVGRFIADPKQPLHVAVNSVDGLGAADAGLLNDPNALLDRLAITASNGQ